MRTMVMAAGAAVMAIAATSASAQDRMGYLSIAGGDLSAAQATLERERAIFPDRPELMVNLAAVYARTGRTAEARALYADVLDRDAIDLELGNGSTISSHDVARRGLLRLDTTIAAR